MKKIALAVALLSWPALAVGDSKNPTWWDKFQFLAHNPPSPSSSAVPAKPNAKSGMIPSGISGGRLVKPDLHPALMPTD